MQKSGARTGPRKTLGWKSNDFLINLKKSAPEGMVESLIAFEQTTTTQHKGHRVGNKYSRQFSKFGNFHLESLFQRLIS